MNCYCGSLKNYSDCCETAHKDHKQAITAEQLMRSRYSAFVLADGAYLMHTHHASTRPIKEKKAIVKWAKSVQWLKLEIIKTSKGQRKDTHGTVTFNAYFYDQGQMDVIHEKSAFVKENHAWYYVGFAQD